jgi:DNA-binding NtrC family response regulator
MDPERVTLHVVMVDDEEALCLGVQRIIQKYKVHVPDVLVDASYSFRHFTTGEDYLAYLGEGGEVDLLLLDLKLPGVGGMDVLDAMSSQGREVLTIMITAYATFETAVKATKLGAYDFLAKPFTPDELRYTVRKATSQLILSKQARKLAEEKRQVRFNFISVLAHAAQRGGGLPEHPAHRRAGPEPADGGAQHHARGRHEEAHRRPA